jgi:hypothetical protein
MSANNEKEVEGAEGNVTLKERGEEEHRGWKEKNLKAGVVGEGPRAFHFPN